MKSSRTKENLIAERRKKNLPDPSYDLNGDGIVSAREYFLSKRFDNDKDGRLNTAERENTMKALKNGYEDQFVWNVEETGPYRGKRIMQIRGEFVDAEDFVSVTNTYPEHPLNNIRPETTNIKDLKYKRKMEIETKLKKNKDTWDKLNPSTVLQKYKLSEFLVDNPK